MKPAGAKKTASKGGLRGVLHGYIVILSRASRGGH